MSDINVQELIEKHGTGFLFIIKNQPRLVTIWAYGDNFCNGIDIDNGNKITGFSDSGMINAVRMNHVLSFINRDGDECGNPVIYSENEIENIEEKNNIPPESFNDYLVRKVFSFNKNVEFYPDGRIAIQGEYEDDRVEFGSNQQELLKEYVECVSRARLIEDNVRGNSDD